MTAEWLARSPKGAYEIITAEYVIEQCRAQVPEGVDPLVFVELGEDVAKGRTICVRVPSVCEA